MIRLRLVFLPLLFASAGAAACTEVGTDPSVVTALEFDSLAVGAVAVGDTLRDTTGAPLQLQARAFNASGDEIADAPIVFFTSDELAVKADERLLVAADSFHTIEGIAGARTVVTSVRVFARASELQFPGRTLAIVPRADSIVPLDTVVTFSYSPFADSTTAALRIRVLRDTTITPGVVGSGGYPVRFHLETPAGAPVDTAIAVLVDDAGRRGGSALAASDGTAARRVRVRPVRLGGVTDTVIVVAEATYRGVPVRGSPARIMVVLQPATAP